MHKGIWPNYLVHLDRHLARESNRSREAFGPSIYSIQRGDAERHVARVSSRSREAFGPSIQLLQKGTLLENLVDPERHSA